MTSFRFFTLATLFAIITAITSGCASTPPQTMAFSATTALKDNSKTFDLSPTQVMKATKQVLVTQGFTIDSADLNSGLVKATRHFQDPEEEEQSYNIFASAYLMENSPESTTLTLSATSQTVLHREWTTWWKLLWILPLIPTGTEYQTLITKEGNITEPKLYADFFTAVGTVGSALKSSEKAAAEKAAAEAAAQAAAKAEAERLAAAKAAAEAEAKAEAERAAAAAKAAAEAVAKAEAERIAAAAKAAAEAAAKAEAERIAAAKAAAEAAAKAEAEKAAAAKVEAVRAELAAADNRPVAAPDATAAAQ